MTGIPHRSLTYFSSAILGCILSASLITLLPDCIAKSSNEARAADPAATCFKIHQSSKLCGDIEITVDATALKIFFKQQNAVLISKAPDWTVYKYSLNTKRYYQTPIQRFSNSFSKTRFVVGGQTFSDVPVKLVGPRHYEKFIENVYNSDNSHFQKTMSMYGRHECTGNYPITLEVDGLVTTNFDPNEVRILKILTCVPKIAEIPLFANGTGIDQKKYVYLVTSALTESPVTATTFAPPANFKQVADESKLANEADVQGFADFFEPVDKKH